LWLGGAITNIAAVKHQVAKYHPDVIQSSVIERSEVERQIEMYGCKSAAEREPS
jgi:exopolyphosphatase/guanosine-5'-triphosphate,3'-diphosphate pyrophosphatase